MRVIKLTTKEPATTFLVRAVVTRGRGGGGMGGGNSPPTPILTDIDENPLLQKGFEFILALIFLDLPTVLFLRSLNYYVKFKSQKTLCSVLYLIFSKMFL
jgi:hypothetical protein